MQAHKALQNFLRDLGGKDVKCTSCYPLDRLTAEDELHKLHIIINQMVPYDALVESQKEVEARNEAIAKLVHDVPCEVLDSMTAAARCERRTIAGQVYRRDVHCHFQVRLSITEVAVTTLSGMPDLLRQALPFFEDLSIPGLVAELEAREFFSLIRGEIRKVRAHRRSDRAYSRKAKLEAAKLRQMFDVLVIQKEKQEKAAWMYL